MLDEVVSNMRALLKLAPKYSAGFRVLGVDIDPDIVTRLNSGQTRMEEAGLSTLVSAAVRSGNLVASGQLTNTTTTSRQIQFGLKFIF